MSELDRLVGQKIVSATERFGASGGVQLVLANGVHVEFVAVVSRVSELSEPEGEVQYDISP